MDRVSNRQTTWYLINIKARREQTTEHYVQVFRNLYEQSYDKKVEYGRMKE